MTLTRRSVLKSLAGMAVGLSAADRWGTSAQAAKKDPRWEKAIQRGLEWVARTQSPIRGNWTAGNYPTAMTALAGTALIGSGSTTVQGPYAKNIRRAVDFLLSKSRTNGLIGDPQSDNRYTYGHGFSMLFLSQVLGEEQDEETRQMLVENLTRAVDFSAKAQTSAGGWGYVSAKDGSDFDEGSTTITQVQGLRGCRNAGIPVPPKPSTRRRSTSTSARTRTAGFRTVPATAAVRGRRSPRRRWPLCTTPATTTASTCRRCWTTARRRSATSPIKRIPTATGTTRTCTTRRSCTARAPANGPFRDKLYDKIISEQNEEGSWTGNIGPIYVTACNLIMLQLDKAILPIYQR